MKFKSILLAGALLVLGLNSCKGDDVKVNPADLPQPVKSFVATHFGGDRVKSVTQDIDDVVPEYHLRLVSGIEVEIDNQGNWSEVETHKGAIPLTMAPNNVANYIAKTYPGKRAVKIDREYRGYEVTLSNGTELKFDNDGNFLTIDR